MYYCIYTGFIDLVVHECVHVNYNSQFIILVHSMCTEACIYMYMNNMCTYLQSMCMYIYMYMYGMCAHDCTCTHVLLIAY